MSVTRDQLAPYFSEPMNQEQIDRLIALHIDRQSGGTGPSRAKLRNTGTSVAAVIDHLGAVDGDIEQTAEAFELNPIQVLAAIFFYWAHQEIIDAEITVRHSYFVDS